MNPAPSDRSAWHHSAERQPMQQYLTPEIGLWLSLSWVPCLHNIIFKAICLFEWFWMCIYIICIIYMLFNPNILLWWFFYIYLYILIYYIPNIIVYLFIMYYLMLYRFFYPTGCTKAIVAARGLLSKNPPPWDDPWVNMGGHPPYFKKKNTLLDFLFGLRK